MYIAAERGHTEVCKILLDAGAFIDAASGEIFPFPTVHRMPKCQR